MSSKNGVLLYQQLLYLRLLRPREKRFVPIEDLQELDSFVMGKDRIELLQLSESQNLIEIAPFDLVEFVWLTTRLWHRVPLCILHLRIHKELIDLGCCIFGVICDQLQVFDWHRCDVGGLVRCWYSEVRQVGVCLERVHVLIVVGDLNHCFSIVEVNHCCGTKRHVLRMKTGVPSTVPVLLDMSVSLWTSISTWWWRDGRYAAGIQVNQSSFELFFSFVVSLALTSCGWENGLSDFWCQCWQNIFQKKTFQSASFPLLGGPKRLLQRLFLLWKIVRGLVFEWAPKCR